MIEINKLVVLEEAKKDMYKIVESLKEEDFDSIREQIGKYFDFIQSLFELPEMGEEPEEIAAVIQEDEPDSTNHEEMNREELRQEEVTPTTYRFERKLRGGFLPELGEGYFIPEMLVRDLGLEHGDLVEIIGSKTTDSQTRYMLKVVTKGEGSNPQGRIEHKYCLIEYVDGFLCIREDASGNTLKNNAAFVVKHSDITDLRLQAGDVVDIAYYENRPDETMKVIWKHDSTPIIRKEQSKQVKRAEVKEEKKEKELGIENPEVFANKTVLVVGAKPKEAGYKAILEALGCEVEVYAGTESKSRTRAAIQRSNAVVMVTAYLGHGKSSGSPQVVEICKKAKVPFGFVDSMGNESFIRRVEEVLKRNQELVLV